ncbi:MAG: hypothetical protein AB8G16_06780 [Gammaproteobacteria bacterium]
MRCTIASILSVIVIATLPTSARAEPSVEFVSAFFSAYENARQPDAKMDDIETFLAFLADDLTDHHIAYSRTFQGKDHLRTGIQRKSQSMVSLSQDIESVVVGTSTVVAVVNEASQYHKDDKLKQFQGRTIYVLVFDDTGLIKEIRRYLD